MTTAIAALYCFTPLPDPAAARADLHALCTAHAVRGTLILASEGINGTVAGPAAGIEAVLDRVHALVGDAPLTLRHSSAPTPPFHRLKVRVKREIVTMGEPVDARGGTGTHVAPADWNALIADPDTIVIDTRNAYEVRIGSFAGAIDPGTAGFADFPAWFRAHRAALFAGRPALTVAMFCTGGIRCEKATALLKAEGVSDVRHLQSGILHYLDTIDPADSRWHGECFVFDERVAVGHGLIAGSHELCRASPHYAPGVACPACHDARDPAQQAGYAERHRQVGLAAVRGDTHVGATRSR